MAWLYSILEFLQSNLIAVIGGFLYMTIEYWLGATSLVKPGSVLAVILEGIKKALELLKIKKPEAK